MENNIFYIFFRIISIPGKSQKKYIVPSQTTHITHIPCFDLIYNCILQSQLEEAPHFNASFFFSLRQQAFAAVFEFT